MDTRSFTYNIHTHLSSLNVQVHSVCMYDGFLIAVLYAVESTDEKCMVASVTKDVLESFLRKHGLIGVRTSVSFLPVGVMDVNGLMLRISNLDSREKFQPSFPSQRMDDKVQDVQAFVFETTKCMYLSMMADAINSLPWRNADYMWKQTNALAVRAADAMRLCTYDPLHSGNVDEVLPLPCSFLGEMDLALASDRMKRATGLTCPTLLQRYEALYKMVCDHPAGKLETAVLMLFECVFCTQWEHLLCYEDFSQEDDA